MADKQQPKADRGWGQKEGFELQLDMKGQPSGMQRKTAQATTTNVHWSKRGILALARHVGLAQWDAA